jgi:copper chaperone NosL
MRPRGWPLALFALALLAGCRGSGPPAPAELDTRTEMCHFCRMGVSDRKLSAQIVAPAEEPLFFDEIGCLRGYLAEHPKLPQRSVAYVADHRTAAWVPAVKAVYVRVPALETPMGSHLVAHADAASRAADRDAAGGQPLSARDLFGPAELLEGRPCGPSEGRP